MIKNDLIHFINNEILNNASKLRYEVKDDAPSTELALFSTPSLVIWSGASDNTIFQDKVVNWAFRALHDDLHLKSGLGFSPAEEIILGRLQASKTHHSILADLIYCEVAGQAEYFSKTGKFVDDQVAFTLNFFKNGLKF